MQDTSTLADIQQRNCGRIILRFSNVLRRSRIAPSLMNLHMINPENGNTPPYLNEPAKFSYLGEPIFGLLLLLR